MKKGVNNSIIILLIVSVFFFHYYCNINLNTFLNNFFFLNDIGFTQLYNNNKTKINTILYTETL